MIHRTPRPPDPIIEALDAALAGAGPSGPANPENGHSYECECGPCAVFWDTWRGTLLWSQWCKRTPHSM